MEDYRGTDHFAELTDALIVLGDVIRQFGPRPEPMAAYVLILRAGPIGPQPLAERLGVSPRTVEPWLSDLRDRQLIEAAPDPADRRRTLYSPTAAGRKHFNDALNRSVARGLSTLRELGLREADWPPPDWLASRRGAPRD